MISSGLLDPGRCHRCGFCLPVCPTYRDTGIETQSPRGRVALIKAAVSGTLALSRNLQEQLYHCLDCRACETVCPAGVRIGAAVTLIRSCLDERFPRSLFMTLLLKQLWPYHGWWELASRLLHGYQSWSSVGNPWHRWLLSRLPVPVAILEQLLPTSNGRPLRTHIDEVLPARGKEKQRVGFFLGCVMNAFFPQVSLATIQVLAENGCQVVIPKDVRCCGAPHHSLGDFDTLKKVARHNIALFRKSGVSTVITDCAACGAMLKEYGELLPDEGEEFSTSVCDISEFLTQMELRPFTVAVPGRFTYHDPCHLVHAQGVARQPRQLLQAIPGLELVEMAEAEACCGSAGIYNLTHPSRAANVLDRKMSNIAASGAAGVVTANPGCLMQLAWGTKRTRQAKSLWHISQLLAQAYGLPPKAE
ncbi:MAG: (Fe-S)-binding protein [Chloroflexi bacterium]|nr:(Fe-S)-binding protein [Chloroflexota bacterium]